MTPAEKLPEVVKENNIVSVEQSPLAAAERLLNAGADLDKIEKMLELQERFEQMQAKKAYTQAMAAFKADPPKINKDKRVGFESKRTGGATSYSHASLGNVTEKINKALAEHGLSAAWKTGQNQNANAITVTCTITHKLGYSESTSLTAGSDNSGNKNSIQAIGSTITYLQRYTLLALTGLATHDQDDDGKTAEIQYIDEKQVSQIVDMINSIENLSEKSFLSWAKIESVGKMPVYDFGKNLNALKAKAKASRR